MKKKIPTRSIVFATIGAGYIVWFFVLLSDDKVSLIHVIGIIFAAFLVVSSLLVTDTAKYKGESTISKQDGQELYEGFAFKDNKEKD